MRDQKYRSVLRIRNALLVLAVALAVGAGIAGWKAFSAPPDDPGPEQSELVEPTGKLPIESTDKPSGVPAYTVSAESDDTTVATVEVTSTAGSEKITITIADDADTEKTATITLSAGNDDKGNAISVDPATINVSCDKTTGPDNPEWVANTDKVTVGSTGNEVEYDVVVVPPTTDEEPEESGEPACTVSAESDDTTVAAVEVTNMTGFEKITITIADGADTEKTATITLSAGNDDKGNAIAVDPSSIEVSYNSTTEAWVATADSEEVTEVTEVTVGDATYTVDLKQPGEGGVNKEGDTYTVTFVVCEEGDDTNRMEATL